MEKKYAVVAVCDSNAHAEDALKELQESGFEMKNLSIVGRDYHPEEHVVGYYNSGEKMKSWGEAGGFWGGAWGRLFGSAFFSIPGMGAVLIGGPLVAAMVATLESAVVVGGLSVIGAALYTIGVPEDTIVEYETALKSNKFLLVAEGTEDEVAHARGIMRTEHAPASPAPA